MIKSDRIRRVNLFASIILGVVFIVRCVMTTGEGGIADLDTRFPSPVLSFTVTYCLIMLRRHSIDFLFMGYLWPRLQPLDSTPLGRLVAYLQLYHCCRT